MKGFVVAALGGLVAIAVYVYYRTTFAAVEPFGPLYEWAAATAVALLLILSYASRSTRAGPERSIPESKVRHHSQSVRALRDPSYEILRGLLHSFVERGENQKELARELARLSGPATPDMFEELAVAATRVERRGRSSDPVERERRLHLVRRVMERLGDGSVGG